MRELFDELQIKIGRGNAQRGFHAEGDALRAAVAEAHPKATLARAPRDAALRNYYMVKLGLIITEAAEGLEDLRNGRPVNQNYYTHEGKEVHKLPIGHKGSDMWTLLDRSASWTLDAIVPKPEGVPSEIADIVIRCLDFADEAGFSLINAILEKLAYNDTRAHMHGKQV